MPKISIPVPKLHPLAQIAILFMAVAIAIIAVPGVAYSTGQMAFQQHEKGVAAFSSGDYQTALKHNIKATDMANDIPRYRVGLAHTLHALGQYDRAISEYTIVLEIKPNQEAALCGRALTYDAIGASHLAEKDRRQFKLKKHQTELKMIADEC